MKKWKDIDDVFIKKTDIKETRYSDMMKSKPNFDKRKGTRKVYTRKEFIILETSRSGYLVYNTNKNFKGGHTHVGSSFQYAKSIIDLATRKAIPKNPSGKLISSLIRISNDEKYIENLQNKL